MGATIEEQTGWKRGPGPRSLCQDEGVLANIKTLTYDENNYCFQLYYQSRIGWMLSRGLLKSFESMEYPYFGKVQDCWELFIEAATCKSIVETPVNSKGLGNGPY